VVDIHCHILPEVDDGPKNWETAEAMCRMASEDGVEHMVATPHANDRYYYDRAYLQQLLGVLQQRIGPEPELSLGCDFHLSFENMKSALETPERYCIGNSRYLLVEFSNFSIPQQVDLWFAQMIERGSVPIITHPERNPLLQKDTRRVLNWIELGCTVQVTASALTGGWGERAGEIARWLLQNSAVHFLASDGHEIQRRVPVLSAAKRVVAKEFGEPMAQALVETNPRAVITNSAL
jgi:protein-tyrosine phosphatase